MEERERERIEVRSSGGTTDTSVAWMGWIGIIAGIISFFYAPLWMGGIAIILGLITVFSKASSLGWWSIGLGIVGMLVRWFYNGTFY